MVISEPVPARWRSDRPVASARVLFFGKVADALGRAMDVDIPQTGCSLADLRDRIAQRRDGAAAALGESGVRAAIKQQTADDCAWVLPGDEAAFFSVFSGG